MGCGLGMAAGICDLPTLGAGAWKGRGFSSCTQPEQGKQCMLLHGMPPRDRVLVTSTCRARDVVIEGGNTLFAVKVAKSREKSFGELAQTAAQELGCAGVKFSVPSKVVKVFNEKTQKMGKKTLKYKVRAAGGPEAPSTPCT
eukprot:355524-Chlamydomonas_euryale.AAC.10